MCAYNEQDRIGRAISELLGTVYPCDVELIVVDDGSTDATSAVVEQFDDSRIILRRHKQNMGKGASLITASHAATGTHIIPFDADLEYIPEDIPRLVEPILKGRCEVVYGVRLFGYNTVYRSYLYAIGNRLLTTFANVLYDARLSDLHTCLKLVPAEIFKSLRLREKRFGLDTELTAAMLRIGIRPFEVPVSYFSRSRAQGKKINWRDALACLAILLRLRVTPLERIAPALAAGTPRRRALPRPAELKRQAPAAAVIAHVAHVSFDGDGQAGEEASAAVTR
jgi:glycosyltransferase involved in cell wall biosynthesis